MSHAQEQTVRLPPQNLDAERSVLGSIFRDNAVLDEVAQIVGAGSFYTDAHRKVFNACVKLRERGDAIDLVTLAEHLKEQKQLEDVGQHAYLAGLWDAAPTAANAVYYARIVRDKALVRNLIHASTETLRDAYDLVAPAGELVEAAERRVLGVAELGAEGSAVPMSAAVERTRARLEARLRRKQGAGLPTGFIDLDRLTGGLQDGELVLLAARPSLGKTSLALALINNVAVDRRTPVFIASLEQSAEELTERLVCMVGQVDSHSLRCGRPNAQEFDLTCEALNLLETRQVFIDDAPGQTVGRIAANARRFKARHGIRAVFIDYIQLIEPDNRRDPRHEQVSVISRRLKNLARELQLPVVALAQLNREIEHRADPRPKLSDLKDTGALEQDADTVMLLHRPADAEGVIDVLVAKQRNGPTGDVRLTFRPEFYKFDNHAPGLPE